MANSVRWVETRSGFQAREVFTLEGVEYVRVSREAFSVERGDLEIAMKTRGLAPLLLRRRDTIGAHLREATQNRVARAQACREQGVSWERRTRAAAGLPADGGEPPLDSADGFEVAM